MTTAHRPTWQTALGGSNQGGNRLVRTTKVCGRDQPGELRLKSRKDEQKASTTDRKALGKSLDIKENQFRIQKRKAESTLEALPELEDNPYPEDADEDVLDSEEEKEDDDDESDEEAEELMRELEKIRREKAEKEAIEERKKQEEIQKEQQERMIRANPLLMNSGELKRRWDDDVVFKNQAKNLPKLQRQFINDPVRSEFHKKFLHKYVD